jgi:hypothetical protein
MNSLSVLAVRSTDLIATKEPRSGSDNPPPDWSTNQTKLAEYRALGPSFSEWLRMLSGCRKVLQMEVETIHEQERYLVALSRWREAGYPDPGEWPDSAFGGEGQLFVQPYTGDFVDKWANN